MSKFKFLACGLYQSILLITVLFSHGLSAAEESSRTPGRIIVAKVVGTVTGQSDGQSSARSLSTNDEITEKYTVTSAAESSAVLVFSNGSSLNLSPGSILVIEQFLQDPFSDSYQFAQATAEPTTSVTKLNLKQGEVVCNVKKLNVGAESPSTFEVSTPVGSAGIRGTSFAIKFVSKSGTASYSLSVTDGLVAFTDSKGKVTEVPKGKQLGVEAQVINKAGGDVSVTFQADAMVIELLAAIENAINQSLDSMSDATAKLVIKAMIQVLQIALPNSGLDKPPIVDPKNTTEVDP